MRVSGGFGVGIGGFLCAVVLYVWLWVELLFGRLDGVVVLWLAD